MKNIFKRILSVITLGFVLPVSAASYTYTDDAATATTYPWIEVAPIPTGTSCVLPSGSSFLTGSNNSIGVVSLPFSFVYGGISYNTISASANGYIQLGTVSIANSNVNSSLNVVPTGFIGLFLAWNDMLPPKDMVYSSANKTCPGMYYKTIGAASNRTFIFEYNDVEVRRTTGFNTAQIQIHESSNIIVFKYKNMYLSGQNATSGIIINNQIAPVDLLQYSYNSASLPANKTIAFTPSNFIHHYEIEFTPDNQGLTCVSKDIKVRACTSATSPCLSTVEQSSIPSTITLNTSLGTFINGANSETMSITGTINNSISSNAIGTANVSLTTTIPVSCFSGTTLLGACTTTFNETGLIVDWLTNKKILPSEGVLDAGDTSAVVKLSSVPACGTFNANTTSNVNVSLGYLDPLSGSRNISITPTNSSGVGSTSYTIGTSIQSVPLIFDSTGAAYFKVRYLDAGRIKIDFSVSSIASKGTTSLISKPYTIKAYNNFSDVICQNGTVLTTNTLNKFCQAGESFSVKVRAFATDGVTVLPNFGKESMLSSITFTGTLKSPSGGNAGNIGNTAAGTTSSLSSGVTVNKNYTCNGVDCYLLANLSWDNVGEINLSPMITGDNYFGAGVLSVKSYQPIGRFYPFNFKINSSSLVNRSDLSCSSNFTYMDEKFALLMQLMAINKSGSVTSNYNGIQMNVTSPASWGIKGHSGVNILTSRLNFISGAGVWANGILDASLGVSLGRNLTPDGMFANAKIGIAPIDLDGVQLVNYDTDFNNDTINDGVLVANTNFYFGRLKLFNTNGSDLIKLPIKIESQYFNGFGFIVNTEDNCTPFTNARFSTSNFTQNLSPLEISFIYPTKLINGKQIITLNKPNGGDGIYNGSFDLHYDLSLDNKPYLLGRWNTSFYNEIPKAKIVLSRKKNKGKVIFVRENF